MVAKVSTGKNILGMLNYNENKVRAGSAKCIHENLYGRDVNTLSFHNKLGLLQNFSDRNRRATSKAVHISLNFHPEDKLNNAKLAAIADTYMEQIGFGNQPYLVYRHHDAAHPHIHIITTNIQRNGKRIIMYNLGRNQSQKARKEIETEFGLIIAQGRRTETKPESVRATYGKSETKRGIANAVRAALKYKYTSLPEFNAVLKQFNIVADRGREGSAMYQKKGLVYCMLDQHGKKVGIPIKASSIDGKPTLTNLEKNFKLNALLRQPHKEKFKDIIRNSITDLGQRNKSLPAFIKALNSNQVFVVLRQNNDGLIYGITFVDNKSKIVFNGSDLGKEFSAKALTEKFSAELAERNVLQEPQLALQADRYPGLEEAVDELITARQYEYDFRNLPRRKKKKRRRRL